jgi:hypothetical protein
MFWCTSFLHQITSLRLWTLVSSDVSGISSSFPNSLLPFELPPNCLTWGLRIIVFTLHYQEQILIVFLQGVMLGLGFDDSVLHSCAGARQALWGRLMMLLPLVYHTCPDPDPESLSMWLLLSLCCWLSIGCSECSSFPILGTSMGVAVWRGLEEILWKFFSGTWWREDAKCLLKCYGFCNISSREVKWA